MLYIFSFLHQTATAGAKYQYKDKLYIFSFLHQTATAMCLTLAIIRCISLVSYIKPQL